MEGARRICDKFFTFSNNCFVNFILMKLEKQCLTNVFAAVLVQHASVNGYVKWKFECDASLLEKKIYNCWLLVEKYTNSTLGTLSFGQIISN